MYGSHNLKQFMEESQCYNGNHPKESIEKVEGGEFCRKCGIQLKPI